MSGGCDPGNEDLSRRSPPEDPEAYARELAQQRQERGRWFATAEGSPVPQRLRPDWGGLDYYAVDPRLRFEGPLIRRTTGRTFAIVTTSGEQRPCREVGYFRLDLGGGAEILPVYELLDQEAAQRGLFIPFMDATTGDETYPAGRYLEAIPAGRGRYLLDFNLAYNPSCAYGGSFQCPVTPEENRLRAAVRAGERGYHREEPESRP
jgi:uncharacterized protein (DUF1684 family)